MKTVKQYLIFIYLILICSTTTIGQSQFGVSTKTAYPLGKSFLRYGITGYAMFKDDIPKSRNYFHWKIQYLFPLTTTQHYAPDDLARFDPNNKSNYLNYKVRTSSVHLSAVGARHNFESVGGNRKFAGFGVGASMFMFKGEIDTHHDTYIQNYISEGKQILFDVNFNPFAGLEFDLKNDNKIHLELDMDFNFLRFAYWLTSLPSPMNEDPIAVHYSPLQLGFSIGYSF